MQQDNDLLPNSSVSVDRHASPAGPNKAGPLVTAAAVSIAYAVMALGWKELGLPSGATPQSGYQFTHVVAPSFLWQAVVFSTIGLAAGFLAGRTWAVGFGLLLPLAVAAIIEISKDPTSHNLLPIEIVLLWMPPFVVGLVAALIGRRIRGNEIRGGEQMGEEIPPRLTEKK